MDIAPEEPGHLTLLLQFGGEPAETRVYARNGEELPQWQLGPGLAESLERLQAEGWRVSEGRLWRRANTLFPVPILILHKPTTSEATPGKPIRTLSRV